MLFFETNQPGFTTEFLGRIRWAGGRAGASCWAGRRAPPPPTLPHPPYPHRLVAAIASLIGVGVYNYALKETSLRWVLRV